MIARILVTVGIVLYAVAVPVLEINDTHVFNPEWVPHARLHEVWQLVTNTAFGALSLWLVWFRNEAWRTRSRDEFSGTRAPGRPAAASHRQPVAPRRREWRPYLRAGAR